jgi:hypothetical protein
MRLAPVYLLGLCALLAGCGPKPPTPTQITAALNASVQKENPEASVSINGGGMGTGGKYMNVRFACSKCMRRAPGGEGKIPADGNGSTVIGLDAGKWHYDFVQVDYEDGERSILDEKHTF